VAPAFPAKPQYLALHHNRGEAPAGRRNDLYDVLITTDVLSEGMNLQQCRNIINYDLPWNPMRLVQRHGRVDRIGGPHRDVYLYCFFSG
jgi:superfamily II DNA/RNA helicase